MASQQAAAVFWRDGFNSDEMLIAAESSEEETINRGNVKRCSVRDDKNTTNCLGVAGGPVQQHPVSAQEVLVPVPDGVSQLPDVDGVHHAKAFQLVHAQVPVKHLEGKRS